MKRKICIAISTAIFLLGVWGVLTRKDPVEKNIGIVYLSDGENEIALKGYKVSVNRNGKSTEYDYPGISEKSESLYNISTSAENNSEMKLSFHKDFCGDILYDLYDVGFNEIYQKQNTLNVPAESGGVYYAAVNVKWGTENENVSMIYYFSIKT